MRALKTLALMLTILLMCEVRVPAQSVPSPQASVVDEFSAAVACEDFLARMDNFMVVLQNDPSSMGYVALYGEGGNILRNFRREQLVKFFVKWRGMDQGRLNIIPGEMRPEATTEFWLAPLGASPPEIVRAEWSHDLSRVSKPFMLGAQSADGIEGCDNYSLPLFAVFLKANPRMHGRVVVREVSAAKFRRLERDVLRELVGIGGIGRRRLRTDFVKVRPNSLLESIELWVVP